MSGGASELGCQGPEPNAAVKTHTHTHTHTRTYRDTHTDSGSTAHARFGPFHRCKRAHREAYSPSNSAARYQNTCVVAERRLNYGECVCVCGCACAYVCVCVCVCVWLCVWVCVGRTCCCLQGACQRGHHYQLRPYPCVPDVLVQRLSPV